MAIRTRNSSFDASKNASDTIAQLTREKEDLDAGWRKKYRDRFFHAGGTDDEDFGVDLSDHGGPERKTYDSLFKSKSKGEDA